MARPALVRSALTSLPPPPHTHTLALSTPLCRYLVIDLAFVIESREEADLPEVLLGGVRLSRMDVDKAPIIEHNPEDWRLGTQQAYGK